MSTSSEAVCVEEWAEAIAIGARHISKADIKRIATHTTFEWNDRPSIHLAYFRYGHGSLHKVQRLEVVVHPLMRTFRRGERIEAMLWILSVAQVWFASSRTWHPTKPYAEHIAYCRAFGCSVESSLRPSERWHKASLHFDTDERLLIPELWDKMCGLCGKGIFSDEPSDTVHANCRLYISNVMIPARKAEIAARASDVPK